MERLTDSPSPVEDSRRKSLGAFYTPNRVARPMIEWAVRDVSDTVLDPSFGGCVFLEEAATRLENLGVVSSPSVFGVDIDVDATAYADMVKSRHPEIVSTRIQNFFQPDETNERVQKVSAVVGNPPYVRHHALEPEVLNLALDSAKSAGHPLSARSSLWAPFIVHSLRFLREGGRIAFVLPKALAYADYAKPIREGVLKSFAQVHLIFLEERIFEESDEQSVILLADGYGEHHQGITVDSAETVADLDSILKSVNAVGFAARRLTEKSILEELLTEPERLLYSKLQSLETTSTLGELATIRIGVVTGANSLFIVSDQVAESLDLPEGWTLPILSKAAQIVGLSINESDVVGIGNRGVPSRLIVIPANAPLPEKLSKRLKSAMDRGVANRHHCKIRSPWYSIDPGSAPDAFLTYMAGGKPRLALNSAATRSTNTIHQLRWTDPSRKDASDLLLASNTSLFELSAEIVGRSYGGGVLKVEPKEASQLLLPIPELDDASILVRRIDSLLRIGNHVEAKSLADNVVLRRGLGLSENEVEILKTSISNLRRRRIVPRIK